jgi:hypothetical protein
MKYVCFFRLMQWQVLKLLLLNKGRANMQQQQQQQQQSKMYTRGDLQASRVKIRNYGNH